MAAGHLVTTLKLRHVRGRGDVVLLEFADYECPFCGRHERETVPRIKQDLIDTGILRYAFLSFPLPMHPNAQKASEAAECAAKQGKFWETHERLFDVPVALAPADLLESVAAVGVERVAFARCLDSGEGARLVQADVGEGQRLGVRSTPAFFLGRIQQDGSVALIKRVNGAVEFEHFDAVVRELSEQRRAER